MEFYFIETDRMESDNEQPVEELEAPKPKRTKETQKRMPRTDKQKTNLAKAVQALREKREQEWEQYLETKKKQSETVPKIDIKQEPPQVVSQPQYLTKADLDSILETRLSSIFKPGTEQVQQIEIVRKSKPKKKVVYVSDSSDDEPVVIKKPKAKSQPPIQQQAPPAQPALSKRDALLSYLML